MDRNAFRKLKKNRLSPFFFFFFYLIGKFIKIYQMAKTLTVRFSIPDETQHNSEQRSYSESPITSSRDMKCVLASYFELQR